ncbi:MAG: hypothetical protein CMH41_03070 [Micrococcales bacterium]|nr:hypothetical protein [Micrococcales bacterium]
MTDVKRTTSFIWRHATLIRAVMAGLLLIVGVLSWASSHPAPQTSEIVIASRDIPSGSVLANEDLAIGHDSLGLATLNRSDLVGEIVRGPIKSGEPVTPSRITPGRSLQVVPGRVVFPLALSDERLAALLVAGDVVNVIVTPGDLSDGEVRTLARQVEVLTVSGQTTVSSGLTSPGSGAVVLLDVSDIQAADLSQIQRSDRVSVTIGSRAVPANQ